MATKTIGDFKTKLAGGGARPNLFNVRFTTFPDPIKALWPQSTADLFEFLCKGAALPAQNVASIDVPFRGRIFKVAGDRTIDTWTVTIINDEDFLFRTAFEGWMEHMARLDNNMGATQPSAYMTQATVQQLSRGGHKAGGGVNNTGADQKVLKEYTFVDMFPTNVSQIDLSYDSGDTIEEYTVEFAVNSFTLTGSGTSP